MSADTKLCPFCREEIKLEAIRCRYCQAMLDGSMPTTGHGSTPDGHVGRTPGSGGFVGHGGVLPAGTVVQNYEIKRVIGQGGMGVVYEAVHQYTQQRVALKAVWQNLMADETSRRRFLEEGRTMALLKHGNIVPLLNFFEEGGTFYLVMEYLEGKTLDAVVGELSAQGKRLEIDKVVIIAGQVLSALSYAHGQNPAIVHRDIKPQNIMLTREGKAVLMDFGIAKVLGREQLTRTRGVVGTYEYMSPEQVQGSEVSPASDVYSMGIVLYQMLGGTVPFPQTSETGLECMNGHVSAQVPDVRGIRPDCPATLAAVVRKALEKDPATRYRDAGEMGAGLVRGRIGSTESNPESVPEAKCQQGSAVSGTSAGGPEPGDHVTSQGPDSQDPESEEPKLPRTSPLLKVAVGLLLVALLPAPILLGLLQESRQEEASPENPQSASSEPADKPSQPEASSASSGVTWIWSKPSGLYFAMSETTVAQYRVCVEAGVCSPPDADGARGAQCAWFQEDSEQRPMDCVASMEAQDFCQWVGGRLPTMEEWVAEASDLGQRLYPWGNTGPSCDLCVMQGVAHQAESEGCWKHQTWPVCSKTSGNSVSGLCDMSGNALEWSWTLPSEDRGKELLCLGGSVENDYRADRDYLLASSSVALDRAMVVPTLGFRCVREVGAAESTERIAETAAYQADVRARRAAEKAALEKRRAEEEAARKADEERRIQQARTRLAQTVGIEWIHSKPAGLDFSKTETTVRQYAACVEAGLCLESQFSARKGNDKCNYGAGSQSDHPMNCVNWYGAETFCRSVGGRLPTEQEWYAEASDGGKRKYPWGKRKVSCNTAVWGDGKRKDGCGKESTWPVCSKTKGNSVSGLCDLSGNVWEWTSSAEGSARVLRGGSWGNDAPEVLLAAGRFGYGPGNWVNYYGFRCVRDSKP